MKIGDAVRVKITSTDDLVRGHSGRIVQKGNEDEGYWTVEFDYHLMGLWGDNNNQWYVNEYDLEPIVVESAKKPLLPTDSQERKKYPVCTGVLDYFPSAILEIARVSYEGNKQHNPGQPLHWARGRSTDQEDTTLRHTMERTVSEDSNQTFTLTRDIDGTYHMAKACWRLLATFQLLLEAEGAPLARGARLPEDK